MVVVVIPILIHQVLEGTDIQIVDHFEWLGCGPMQLRCR